MDAEDRAKYLKWFRNAQRLLAEKPFTYCQLFHRLYEDVTCDEDISAVFDVIIEAGWSDPQILEFLYIGSEYDKSTVENFIETMSWDIDRLWRALKDLYFNDEDTVYFLYSLDNNMASLIAGLLDDNWNYVRIVNAMSNHLAEIVLVFENQGSNDFRIIELLQLYSIDGPTIINEISDWEPDRIVKAFHYAGYHRNCIYGILCDEYESETIFKAMLSVWPDPLLIIKIISLPENGTVADELFSIIRESGDIISNKSEILEQLEMDSDDIANYLDKGYFTRE